ncbi:MAG: hypothetical protein ACRCXM_16470 [Beijerinckiaceae bacterium]
MRPNAEAGQRSISNLTVDGAVIRDQHSRTMELNDWRQRPAVQRPDAQSAPFTDGVDDILHIATQQGPRQNLIGEYCHLRPHPLVSASDGNDRPARESLYTRIAQALP